MGTTTLIAEQDGSNYVQGLIEWNRPEEKLKVLQKSSNQGISTQVK